MTYVDTWKAPMAGGGSSGAVDASGLSGALGGSGGTGAPMATSGYNLPSYNTLSSIWNVTQAPANAAADMRINTLTNSLGLKNAQAGIQRGQLTQDTDRARQQLGLQGQSLADQLGAANKTEADINYNADRQIQNFMGGQAARGATNTEGTTRGIQDFQRQRWRGIENLNLDKAQLSRTAKNLGMQEEDLGIRLDRSLQQLGLDQALQAQDILQAITDTEAGRFNPLSSLLGQIYQLSGIRPVVGEQGPSGPPEPVQPQSTIGGGSAPKMKVM